MKKNIKAPSCFPAMVDSIPEALIAVDNQNKVIGWNKAAERMYGWPAEEALGKVIDKLFQTKYRNLSAANAIKELDGASAWSGEVTQLFRDGRRVPVLSSVSVFNDDHG